MRMPVTLFLGIRLSALSSQNRFVSLTSRMAVMGIMLGVSTLITVLSVMKGFEHEIRHSMVKSVDHLHVYAIHDHYPKDLYEEIKSLPHVISVSGYAESYGLIKLHKQYLPMLLMAYESEDLEDGAIQLSEGDAVFLSNQNKVTVLFPSLKKMMPKVSDLRYQGQIDRKRGTGKSIVTARVSYPTYQTITGKYYLTGLAVEVDDLYATQGIKSHIQDKYKGLYQVFDWKDRYQPLFSALKLQQTGMVFVLSMITLVALFSLISGLMMLSSDRQAEIALLQVMGMSPKKVKQIFMIQGALIGLMGVCLGLVLGLTLCHYSAAISEALEYLLGFELIDERVYGTSKLPTVVEPWMVIQVAVMGWIASILASWYPASQIARKEPCEVLRHV